jgi:hypothetical protein
MGSRQGLGATYQSEGCAEPAGAQQAGEDPEVEAVHGKDAEAECAFAPD